MEAEQRWEGDVSHGKGLERAAIRRVAHEEGAIKDRYPALRTIAGVLKIFAVLFIVLMWIGYFGYVTVLVHDTKADSWVMPAVAGFLGVVLASVLTWLVYFSLAETILLAIDVSNDLHVSRILLKERFINDTSI